MPLQVPGLFSVLHNRAQPPCSSELLQIISRETRTEQPQPLLAVVQFGCFVFPYYSQLPQRTFLSMRPCPLEVVSGEWTARSKDTHIWDLITATWLLVCPFHPTCFLCWTLRHFTAGPALSFLPSSLCYPWGWTSRMWNPRQDATSPSLSAVCASPEDPGKSP